MMNLDMVASPLQARPARVLRHDPHFSFFNQFDPAIERLPFLRSIAGDRRHRAHANGM